MQQLPGAVQLRVPEGSGEQRPLLLAKPFMGGRNRVQGLQFGCVTGEELLGVSVFKDASGKALSLCAAGWGAEARGPWGVPQQGAGLGCPGTPPCCREQQGKRESQSCI